MAWDGVDCIDRNTEITGYTVRFDPPSSDGRDEVSAGGDGHNGGSATLTGLIPFTSYSIGVVANSDLGRGPFSSAITVMTAEACELLITDIILFGDVKCCSSPQHLDL